MLITNTLMHQIKNCYDIRSTNITNEDAFLIGKAFGSELIERNKQKAVIGYDRRKYSKPLHDNFIQGLLSTGINVVSIGRCSTPMIQLARIILKTDAAISITASHNPPEYQGIKLFYDKTSFSDENLSKLIARILQKHFHKGSGILEEQKFEKTYADVVGQHINIQGRFKIGWDFLNASAADAFQYMVTTFNGTHYILNHEEDYTFRGFAPDPTYAPRLEELRTLIKEKKLDFAFALDGDVDRCVLLDKHGNMIPGDSLLALFAYFTHKIENKHIKVIWDSKSSNRFINWTKQFGETFISITGHSNIYNLLRKTEADVGGECSGHYMFNSFFGINDGLYSALRFISDLEKMDLTLNEALALLPTVWIADSKAIPCEEDKKEETIERIKNILSRQGVTLDLSDGIKACYSYGWWMIRPSRTEKILRASAEGWTPDGLEQIKEHLGAIIHQIQR